jgi:hypothetical protein
LWRTLWCFWFHHARCWCVPRWGAKNLRLISGQLCARLSVEVFVVVSTRLRSGFCQIRQFIGFITWIWCLPTLVGRIKEKKREGTVVWEDVVVLLISGQFFFIGPD